MGGDVPFGRALRQQFGFEPGYVCLNHGASPAPGPARRRPRRPTRRLSSRPCADVSTPPSAGSYGSPPNPVRKAMREFSDRVEANPDRFVVQELAPMLARVRAALAELVWARPEEVVVVPNASHGINTVLWNLDWAPNDLILACASASAVPWVLSRSRPPAQPPPALLAAQITRRTAPSSTRVRTSATATRASSSSSSSSSSRVCTPTSCPRPSARSRPCPRASASSLAWSTRLLRSLSIPFRRPALLTPRLAR